MLLERGADIHAAAHVSKPVSHLVHAAHIPIYIYTCIYANIHTYTHVCVCDKFHIMSAAWWVYKDNLNGLTDQLTNEIQASDCTVVWLTNWLTMGSTSVVVCDKIRYAIASLKTVELHLISSSLSLLMLKLHLIPSDCFYLSYYLMDRTVALVWS